MRPSHTRNIVTNRALRHVSSKAKISHLLRSMGGSNSLIPFVLITTILHGILSNSDLLHVYALRHRHFAQVI